MCMDSHWFAREILWRCWYLSCPQLPPAVRTVVGWSVGWWVGRLDVQSVGRPVGQEVSQSVAWPTGWSAVHSLPRRHGPASLTLISRMSLSEKTSEILHDLDYEFVYPMTTCFVLGTCLTKMSGSLVGTDFSVQVSRKFAEHTSAINRH